MAKVTVYSTQFCPYCEAAKRLLEDKGADFEVIDLTHDAEGRTKLIEKSNGMRTVPQIFIGDQHIGGFDQLSALDQKGELDPLLFENE